MLPVSCCHLKGRRGPASQDADLQVDCKIPGFQNFAKFLQKARIAKYLVAGITTRVISIINQINTLLLEVNNFFQSKLKVLES